MILLYYKPGKRLDIEDLEEFKTTIVNNGLPDTINFSDIFGSKELEKKCVSFLINYCTNYNLPIPTYDFLVFRGMEEIIKSLNDYKVYYNVINEITDNPFIEDDIDSLPF